MTKTTVGKELNMLTENPVHLVAGFSVPLIFANVFQQLYYIADAIIVGNFIDINALAAVTSCNWLTWFVNAVARDFSNTVSIMISNRVGKRSIEEASYISGCAASITLLLSFLLTALTELNLDYFFHLFQVQEDIVCLTNDYYQIVLLGIPFVITYNMATAVLRADGNSRISFYAVAISTVLNIVLDLLFICAFHWSVRGGAFATIISQFIAMLILLTPLFKSRISPKWQYSRTVNKKIIKEMGALWAPMMINSLVISVSGSIISRQVNAIGVFLTAGISAATKIFTLIESVFIAIQAGLSVFVGQNLGAGQSKRVRVGVIGVIKMSLMLSILINLIMQPLAPLFVGVFLSKGDPNIYESTLKAGVQDIRVVTMGLFAMTPMYLYRVSVQTIGKPQFAMYAGFLQLVVRSFSVLVLPAFIGYYAYYLATVFAWIASLPVVTIPFYYYLSKNCGIKLKE